MGNGKWFDLKSVEWPTLTAVIGGMKLASLDSDDLEKNPNAIDELIDYLSKDPHVSDVGRIDISTVIQLKVDSLYHKPIVFCLHVGLEDMNPDSEIVTFKAEAISKVHDFIVLLSGNYAIYFSKSEDVKGSRLPFLMARDLLKKVLEQYNYMTIPPNLARGNLTVQRTPTDNYISVKANSDDVVQIQASASSLIDAVKTLYNKVEWGLSYTYVLANYIQEAGQDRRQIFDLNNSTLKIHKELVELPSYSVVESYLLSKKLRASIADLLLKINSYYNNYNSAQKRMEALEESSGSMQLLKPVFEHVKSIHSRSDVPEFRTVEMIISQVTNKIQSLSSYYVVLISSLVGAVVGALTVHFI